MREDDELKRLWKDFEDSIDRHLGRNVFTEEAINSCIDSMELQMWGIKP